MCFFNGALNYEDLKNTPVTELESLISEANKIHTERAKGIKDGF